MEQKLQLSLSLIRGVRNFLQPIHYLPPEVLTIIFYETQQHLPDFLPMSDPSPSTWHWLTLAAVCRHWRGLIATSPHLWSEIDSGTLPERFLKRSSAVPLKVYLGLKMYDMSEEILQSIVSQSKRFRELHLDAGSWEPSSGSSGSIFHRFTSPVPVLTSLTLITEGRDIVNGTLPPIFSGQMPSLRKLCLKHLTSWPRNYFQSLTHLCLYNQNPSTRPTMDEFLEFLQGSPMLEELALVRAGPTLLDVGPPQVPPSRIISLPHLRQLEIGEWPCASLVALFLSHIHLQSQTDMYFWGDRMLNAIHNSEDAGSLALLLPEDISKLENMKDIKKWYLARQPRVILDTPFVSVTGMENGEEGRTLYMYGTFNASQLIPAQLLSRYPVSGVVSLAVRDSCTHTSNANGLDVEFWKQVLERLPALEKLEILAFRSVGFTRAVIGALVPVVTSQTSLPCPLLTSLTIEHDVSLPAYFIRTVVETRAQFTSAPTRLKKLRVLVFEPNPQNDKPINQLRSGITSDGESSVGSNSDSDDTEDIRTENEFQTREEEEYRRHTEDDRKLLEGCPESLGEVEFEYGIPLSVGIVPETWPTRAFEWTRDNPVRRAVV